MIDLHCHVLPALDDGALDLTDTIAMAQQAAADGIRAICATPHIRHDHDVRIAELRERVSAVNQGLARAGVPVEVLTGGEVAETALDGLDDDELRLASLGGGGRWILLEPRPGPVSDSLTEAVDELAARGFGAVIAHPERHLGRDLPERLAALVERGAIVQATAAYFVDPIAGEGMRALAARGLVHVLGSDAHSSLGGRPVRLSSGLAALREVPHVADHVDWIADIAPQAIVRGGPLTPPFAAA